MCRRRHLHNNDDNILTGSAAWPRAISVARVTQISEDRPRFVQLAAYESLPYLSPHLDLRSFSLVLRYWRMGQGLTDGRLSHLPPKHDMWVL